jgi:predicted RNase H-like HicB family nuclease
MEALDVRNLETDRAAEFCALQLVAHPRVDGEELLEAFGGLLILQGEPAAQSVAEAAWIRPELSFNQRREIAEGLAAVGQLDLARSVWSQLLRWQGYGDGNDVGLVEDFLDAGVEQWAAERMHELIDDPATAPVGGQRLRQMRAWLTAACPQPAHVDGRHPSPSQHTVKARQLIAALEELGYTVTRMSVKVSVVFRHEDGKWWAEAPDVPDYVAGADTIGELRALVKEGLEFRLERRVDIVEIAAFDFKVANRSDAIQLSTSTRNRPGLFSMDLTPAGRIIDLGGHALAPTANADTPAGKAMAS